MRLPTTRAELGSCPTCVGNPINPATGNKFQREVDYRSAGPRVLSFERWYNSQDTEVTTLGPGWRHNFDRKLDLDYGLPLAYEDNSPSNSTLFSDPGVACVSGWAQIRARAPGLATTEAAYEGGQCNLKEGSTLRGTLPVGDLAIGGPSTKTLMGVTAVRADGRGYGFTFIGSGAFTAESDNTLKLAIVGPVYELTHHDNTVETYDGKGRLLSIKDSTGYVQTLDPMGRLDYVDDSHGRRISFVYDAPGRLEKVRDPANQGQNPQEFVYTYENGNLKSVRGPGETNARTYHYANAAFPSALTRITDERLIDYAFWTYDSLGRAKTSKHGPASGSVDFTELFYNSDGTTSVEDALGTVRDYTFEMVKGVRKVASISQPCLTDCQAATSTMTMEHDPQTGLVSEVTDFNGNITEYQYNPRGLEDLRIEAKGTSEQRTIDTVWRTDFNIPERIDEKDAAGTVLRQTSYGYKAGTSLRETETITDPATPESRTTTWTYTTAADGVPVGLVKSVDGPRTDVQDVTSYLYDAKGNRIRIINAAGHITLIPAYSAPVPGHDAHGNPTRIIDDANGVETTLVYDERLRLESRSVSDGAGTAITGFTYDGAGLLDVVTLPGGATLDYDHDDARRLSDVTDNLDNHVEYTLDNLGNRVNEKIRDSTTDIKFQVSRTFNALGRLENVKNSTGTIVAEYEYDPQGNRKRQVDHIEASRVAVTTFTPDALNRIEKVRDNALNETLYGYNALDQLEAVQDPAGLITSYDLNALGDLKSLTSPDTGMTNYPDHDNAGNLERQIDAHGVEVNYQYDALKRLTFINYPDTEEDVTYQYDGTNYTGNEDFGVGRLTGVIDQSGTTKIFYDLRGNVKEERRTSDNVTYVTAYTYDDADRLMTITYPSGRVVTYVRDAIGQIDAVKTTPPGGSEVNVATNVQYMPFGGVAGYTLGNGVAVARGHDDDYRVTSVTDGSIQHVEFYYNLRGDVYSRPDFVDSSRSQEFEYYDESPRLKRAEALDRYGVQEFLYDGVGNREELKLTPPQEATLTDDYVYPDPRTSHRLEEINDGTNTTELAYNNAGNVEGRGSSLSLIYNAAGRAKQIGSVHNVFNARGQRVKKTAGSQTIVFHYDQRGRLISEMITPGPLVQREYIWLEDLPLAVETSTEIIVDNTDGAFSINGTWGTSTAAPGYYGTNYRTHGPPVTFTRDDPFPGNTKTGTWSLIDSTQAWNHGYQKSCSGGASFTWNISTLAPGNYDVYVRWVSVSGAGNVSYAVNHAGGSEAHSVSQASGGSNWVLLDNYAFTGSASIVMTKLSGTCFAADAVQFVPTASSEFAQWAAPGANEYEVYAWWPAATAHSAGAVYRITRAADVIDIPPVSQKTNGGEWQSLGTHVFNATAGQGVKLMVGMSGVVAADAVRFRPTAWSAHQRALYYFHVDHLGTPQKVTNTAQQVVWDAFYEPFGQASLITASITQPLRFPGQYFDAETGLHQNWHRDYDPSIGRYLQSDPIGLAGGLSTYGYVSQNPLRTADPTGLLENFTVTLNKQSTTTLKCECGDEYSVFSGLGSAVNDPAQVANTDIGPIPKGRYYIVDRQSGGALGGLRDSIRAALGNDPTKWFALVAIDGNNDDCTVVDGVVRCGFRAHPGQRSQGCVTFSSGDEFFQFRSLLEKTTKGVIPGTNRPYYGTVTVQ